MNYQLICMSFDGEYKRENPTFDAIPTAWKYSDNIGSKWFFYPFYFIVSKNTIRDTPDLLRKFINKRIKTVSRTFKKMSLLSENEDIDGESFVLSLYVNGLYYDKQKEKK